MDKRTGALLGLHAPRERCRLDSHARRQHDADPEPYPNPNSRLRASATVAQPVSMATSASTMKQ